MTKRISGVIFIVTFCVGIFWASQKPLWIDEYQSLVNSIPAASYVDILTGHIPDEANNSPFFYIVHKSMADAVHYDPSRLVKSMGKHVRYKPEGAAVAVDVIAFKELPFWNDSFANTYFRIMPVFCMAFIITGFFYYFSRRYSYGWGVFAMLLCASSWPILWYGLEARPYIYYVALTMLQAFVFLELLRSKKLESRHWGWLAAIHIALAFTYTISILQIMLVGVLLHARYRKWLGMAKTLMVFVLPAAILSYYYVMALKATVHFRGPLYNYILGNISWEIVALMAVFGVLVFAIRVGFMRGAPTLQRLEEDGLSEAGWMLGWTISLMAVFMAGLSFLKLHDTPDGAPFAFRHLIGLVPLGVIAATVVARQLIILWRPGWVRVFLVFMWVIMIVLRLNYMHGYVRYWVGI